MVDNLFVTNLADILSSNLSKSIKLDSTSNRGYIDPPAWVDITNDGNPDIIVNGVSGKLLAFDGVSYEPLWDIKVNNTEAYNSIALGNFTGNDAIHDFLVSYASDQWPNLEWSKQIMINGATGNIESIDSLGHYQTSTPVVIDLNGDCINKAILSVNIHLVDEYILRKLQNILVYIDFKTTTYYNLVTCMMVITFRLCHELEI